MSRSPGATTMDDNERARIIAHLSSFATMAVGRTRHALPRTASKSAGRPTVYTEAIIKGKLEATLRVQRSSLSAVATEISKSAIHRKLKNKEGIQCVTSSLLPGLAVARIEKRLEFCLSNVSNKRDFSDSVHVDEKLFYVSKINRVPYLSTDEETPHLTIQNKNHMTKVMFLVAIARPKSDSRGRLLFDGKIGLWPVIKTKKALRNSKNRATGSDVITPVEMDGVRYKLFVVEKLLPVIKEKWIGTKQVVIQHDNATPHNTATDPNIVDAGKQDG